MIAEIPSRVVYNFKNEYFNVSNLIKYVYEDNTEIPIDLHVITREQKTDKNQRNAI